MSFVRKNLEKQKSYLYTIENIIINGEIMKLADYVSDKLTCLNAIIGLVLGLILGLNHNPADLWYVAIKFILIIGVIITIFPVAAGIYGRYKRNEKFSLTRAIPIFLLIIGEIAFGTVLGVIIGSILIGNFHIDHLRLK